MAEPGKPRTAFHHLATLPPILRGACKRLRQGGEQFVVRKRFWQKIDRSTFDCTDPHPYIAVPSDKDYLLHPAFRRELALEGEAVESRQLHVEHEARWAEVGNAREILAGAGEDLDSVVLRR